MGQVNFIVFILVFGLSSVYSKQKFSDANCTDKPLPTNVQKNRKNTSVQNMKIIHLLYELDTTRFHYYDWDGRVTYSRNRIEKYISTKEKPTTAFSFEDKLFIHTPKKQRLDTLPLNYLQGKEVYRYDEWKNTTGKKYYFGYDGELHKEKFLGVFGKYYIVEKINKKQIVRYEVSIFISAH